MNNTLSIFKSIFAILNKNVKTMRNEKNSDNFRGLIECNYEKCTGCEICTRICPAAGALKIEENEKGTKKLAAIDISRCIFCGSCAYNCPHGALNITKQYELATNNKKDLILNCKEIYKTNMQKMSDSTQTSDIPDFVNEEEI